MLRLLVSSLLPCVFVMACSSSGGSGSSNDPVPSPLPDGGSGAAPSPVLPGLPGDARTAACNAIFDAFRSNEARCDGGPALPEARLAELRTRHARSCVRQFDAPGSRVTPEDVKRCADAVAGSCDVLPDACTQITGTLEDKAPCTANAQCKSGVCSTLGGAGCGQCITLDFHIVAEGEACVDEKAVCGGGAYCDSGSGKCVREKVEGASCTGDYECGLYLLCTGGKCSAGGPEGAACSRSLDCGRGLTCDASGKCARRVYVGAGETCDEVHLCAAGSCSVVESKCVPPLPDGAACDGPEAASCDDFAACIDGKCGLADVTACK